MSEKLFDIVTVKGNDHLDFLQGQITQNIEKLTAGTLHYSAICNPKGRVILTCHIFPLENSVGIVIPVSMTDILISRLSSFILRSDVTIEKLDTSTSLCIDSNELDSDLSVFKDNYHDVSGSSFFTSRKLNNSNFTEIYTNLNNKNIQNRAIENIEWQRLRIIENIVDITQVNTERYTPHMLNLDLNSGVCFNKGCYVGQEIVARTEHIGKVKRRLILYKLSSKNITVDEKLYLNDKDSNAHILSISGDRLAAIINTDFSNQELSYKNGIAKPLTNPFK
jgi:folate-binding protein YgfZ